MQYLCFICLFKELLVSYLKEKTRWLITVIPTFERLRQGNSLSGSQTEDCIVSSRLAWTIV